MRVITLKIINKNDGDTDVRICTDKKCAVKTARDLGLLPGQLFDLMAYNCIEVDDAVYKIEEANITFEAFAPSMNA